jgi:hypothetical protein
VSEAGIEFLFHLWWEAISALTDLVPVERVVTGESVVRPYVCLFVDLAPESRTNSGRSDGGRVLFSVYSDTWQEASNIKNAIKSAFDEQRQAYGNSTITKCRWSAEDYVQNTETGVWQHDVEFEVISHSLFVGVFGYVPIVDPPEPSGSMWPDSMWPDSMWPDSMWP